MAEYLISTASRLASLFPGFGRVVSSSYRSPTILVPFLAGTSAKQFVFSSPANGNRVLESGYRSRAV